MKDLLHIHPADTVAVALTDRPGIPAGHKIALRDIAEGEDVVKYGDPIGHATRPIAKGELVDHHNLATNLRGTLDYSALRPLEDPQPPMVECPQTFMGYLRPDGQAGIRNDIWIVPTVGCVNGICQRIAERAGRGTAILSFSHPYGCSQLGDDHENTRLILRDLVLHPNAGGVLVVGLGCENNQPREFERLLGDYDRSRIRFLVTQEVEGDEVEEGVRIVQELYAQAQTFQRQPLPLSLLRVGLKCGGSDGFSGLTANPLLGRFSDWLCMKQGGTTILTEVPEMFGAEHLLMQRAASEEILQQIVRLINDFKQYYLSHGQPVGENPSPGNKAGGISTLEEKALGCTQKSGSSPVRGVLSYGERLCEMKAEGETEEGRTPSGLHLLSAPGNDLVASTALAAAGCQLVLFTTGRGTPFSTFVPTLKVSTNTDLFQRKQHWMDFDAGTLVSSGEAMESLLTRFTDLIVATANGMPTRAEQAGIHDIAIWKDGVTL